MIRVLVVDDSPVARELITHILSLAPGIQVIGSARNGREAIDALNLNKPDIVTMDINMPVLDGFEATRIIMATNPVPIVIVTGISDMSELDMSFRAIDAGALAVIRKPPGVGHPDFDKSAADLITKVRLMSEVKVVRRWLRKPGEEKRVESTEPPVRVDFAEIRAVAIGASTGGPPVIEKILSQLPADFPAPVLVVQHMAPGFIQAFAEWLGQTSGLPVHVAFNGSIVRAGHVYIAPEGMQMRLDAYGRIHCVKEASAGSLHQPSVSYLFRSVAEVFGENAVGVLLTGMGSDGAEELGLMKKMGAVTVAQDQKSSAVFGMPGEAVKINAASYVLPPDKIAALLESVTRPGRRKM